MKKLELNLKFLFTLMLGVNLLFTSCSNDDDVTIDIDDLLEEETIEGIVDEQVGEIEEEEGEEIAEEEEEVGEEIEEEEEVGEEIEEEVEETEEEEEVVNGVSLPVTIDLREVELDDRGTSFSVDGFNFMNEGGYSESGYVGIALASGIVTLDLSDINNISTISAEVSDNNSAVIMRIFNNGNVVETKEFSSISSIELISIDVKGVEIDAVSIEGFESGLFSITLE